MGKLEERLKKLAGGVESKTDKLIKSKKSIVPGKNGGWRPGAGRPPNEETLIKRGIKAYIEQYCDEEVSIQITDPKTGKTRIVQKPRAVVILERIFNMAMGQTEKGHFPALKEFLDRAIGKAVQPIAGADDGESPILIKLTKDYGEE